MTAPTTQRDEVRQLLAASLKPLTRPEIFDQCKLVGDQQALSTVLCQLVQAGDIKVVGEREREKGLPLKLYVAGSGGGDASAPKNAGGAKRKGKKHSKGRPASASKPRRSAYKKRSKALPKVQRKTATSPDPEGFRCGIFSDGTLAINAEDGQITLSEPETRAMFKYLDHILGSEAA